jgi:DMATS type aromatic prenyltransferase
MSPTFPSIGQDDSNPHPEGAQYWWLISGHDLARMLQEADYPTDTQRQFLLFFKNIICPQLGSRPEPSSLRSGLTWDGNPFEYSLEFKNNGKETAVGFVVDVSALRPGDEAHPLNTDNFEAILKPLSTATPGYDETWYTSLKTSFVHAHLPSTEQKDLVAKVGYQMPIVLEFDIKRHFRVHGTTILVMPKIYFPPCFTAAFSGVTRWATIRDSIHRLSNILTHPNILLSLSLGGAIPGLETDR